MTHMNRAKAQVIRFPQTEKVKDKPRKTGLIPIRKALSGKLTGRCILISCTLEREPGNAPI